MWGRGCGQSGGGVRPADPKGALPRKGPLPPAPQDAALAHGEAAAMRQAAQELHDKCAGLEPGAWLAAEDASRVQRTLEGGGGISGVRFMVLYSLVFFFRHFRPSAFPHQRPICPPFRGSVQQGPGGVPPGARAGEGVVKVATWRSTGFFFRPTGLRTYEIRSPLKSVPMPFDGFHSCHSTTDWPPRCFGWIGHGGGGGGVLFFVSTRVGVVERAPASRLEIR